MPIHHQPLSFSLGDISKARQSRNLQDQKWTNKYLQKKQ